MPLLAQISSTWEVTTLAQRASTALPTQPWLAALWLLLGVAALGTFLAVMGLVLVYAERKLAAHFQCRLGPMRVGWHGILQTAADMIKLLVKEDLVPTQADKLLHLGAPLIALIPTVMMLGVIPASPLVQFADVNIGVLYVTAISGLGVLGILLGGWSSYNKWSLLGAMRAGAQIISYEVSVTLALLVGVLLAGELRLSEIVQSQQAGWWVWRGHAVGLLAFIIFVIASTAETNRTPFDIAEGESELTAGYHTEFSGIRFAFFFLAEFANLVVVCAMATTVFLGGWMPFHIGPDNAFNRAMDLIPPVVWFAGKTGFLIFVLMWFRWTFPRLRVDQLMRLEWKILLPIGLANLLVAAVIVVFRWYFFPGA